MSTGSAGSQPRNPGGARLLRNDGLIGLAVALAAFAAYLPTLSPFVPGEDGGELAAAACTLGIPHPTGYPLFALLGRVFSILPLGDLRVIVKLNLMGALLCAAAAGLFYRLFLFLLREKPFGRVPAGKKLPFPETIPLQRLAAAAAALTLAFSRVYWANATAVEVYALHLVFLALVLLLFGWAVRAHVEREEEAGRRWLLFTYALGLSFSNHMMTVLLAPALLYLYFSTHGFAADAWRKMARGVPAFLLGLTPYLYLPIRASLRPWMNWGDPSTWTNFLQHVSGGQFRFKMFASAAGALEKAGVFFTDLPGELGYPALVFAAAGIWHLARRERRLALALLLVFAAGTAYAVNYDFDDVNFRLNAHMALALCAGAGVAAIAARFTKPGSAAAVAAILALSLAVPALPGNRSAADASRDFAVEQHARGILEPLDSGALVLSGGFNFLSAPAFYLQAVENLRPDIVVLDQDLLRRPWYSTGMAERQPAVFRNARAEMRAYLSTGGIGDPGAGADLGRLQEEKFARYVDALLRSNLGERAVYATPDIHPHLVSGFYAVRTGLVMRLQASPGEKPPPLLPIRFPGVPKNPRRQAEFRAHYAIGYAGQAHYQLDQLHDTAAAIASLRLSLRVDPGFSYSALLLRKIQQGY